MEKNLVRRASGSFPSDIKHFGELMELGTNFSLLESWYKTPAYDGRQPFSCVGGPIHLVITFLLFSRCFFAQDQKRFRMLDYRFSSCSVLLLMFVLFCLEQFLVYLTLLSQYPHTWLFYTGCISERAIAVRGCVQFFCFFVFHITRCEEWEFTLLLTHRDVLFLFIFHLFIFKNFSDILQSWCSSLCGRWEVFVFLVPVFIYPLLSHVVYVLISSRAYRWILRHIFALLCHQVSSVRFIR